MYLPVTDDKQSHYQYSCYFILIYYFNLLFSFSSYGWVCSVEGRAGQGIGGPDRKPEWTD